MKTNDALTAEHARLQAARDQRIPWKKWGPYLSERQWGTVREDYSEGGDAWNYFTHDQARSRAYRWGEDGLAGISDDQQRLCLSLALWNGRDPILKERLFGLTNSESNHGEDVKEYYYYLDSTPIAMTDASYEDMALKLYEHYLWIASSLAHLGRDTGMWDEEDGFFYDVLRLPNGESHRLKVRSMVGLLPLCAATVMEGQLIAKYPEFEERILRFVETRTRLVAAMHDPRKVGAVPGRRLAAILDETKLRRVLAKMLDENEFLSPYGLRSVSRYHAEHPYVIRAGGQEYRVPYLPAESDTGMFGGNSNWRGPIWMPVNALVIRALLHYYGYYGKDFTVECPTGSGRQMNLYQVAEEIGRRLTNIFLRDQEGRRPVYGGTRKFQEDPHWRDYLLFNEYFHGDNGAGLGASHQTGWTGIIARIIELFAVLKSEDMEVGKKAYFKAEVESETASALVAQ
jgi:hypothetical protein